ncbi:MAG: chitobiase/beta-hexosaminidase C-terminal domain-containing protein [Defluviitaleaceae bacterium]|nr:chitobiase/beta-hexosaminidase C-terminal domain-containing protein [Defluviitaleaceae bacterium]MCL2275837.1 chitobiase/beta-hexosaminidase C-terminal domain-containing protein [Defluviitaleaceae bacterium]
MKGVELKMRIIVSEETKERFKKYAVVLAPIIISAISLFVAFMAWLNPRNPPQIPFVIPPEIFTVPNDWGVEVIFASQPGTSVYFTVDGSHPARGSLNAGIDDSFITTTEPTVVKAIAVTEDLKSLEARYSVSLNQVPSPGASRASRGIVSVGEEITLLFHSDATLFYTLDGTDPSHASRQYTSPIPIIEDTYIRARAFIPGYIPSDIIYFRFTVAENRTVIGEYGTVVNIGPPETTNQPQATIPLPIVPVPQTPVQTENIGMQVSYTNERYVNIGGMLLSRRWPTVRILVATDFDVQRVTLKSDRSPEFIINMTSINPRLWEHEVEFRITDTTHAVTVTAYVSDGQTISQLINVHAGSERP